MDLSERVVVITGASRGLGAGVAAELARHGARLGLCSRSQPALEEDEQVLAQRVDVRDAEAVEAFARAVVERHGRIDLWINNAGVLEPIAFVRELTGDALREHLEVNLLGVLHGTRAFLSHLRQRGGEGVLINVSSGAALHGYAGWAAYCAGKAALDRLTECVQLEEAEAGLRAYAVAPGVIDTDMQALIRSMPPERFPLVDKFLQMKADEAFNTPEYVARKLAVLAFDPAHRPAQVVVRLAPEQR